MNFHDALHDSGDLRIQQSILARSSGNSLEAAAYGVLISVLVYYTLQHFNRMDLPLSELLWNSAVWITPSQVLSKLDSSYTPSTQDDLEEPETGFDSKRHASKSNAMRRVLGLDGAGIMTTVQRTRTLSNLGSVFKAKPSDSLPGLGNWDNSCYQNSVLQGLAAMESLPAFLDQVIDSNVSQPTKSALRETVRNLNDPANVGKALWTPGELKSMSSWQQQDAQEYFSKISDELDKDTAKDVKTKSNSVGLDGFLWPKHDAPHSTSVDRVKSTGPTDQTSGLRSNISQLPAELNSLIVQNPLEGLLAQRVGCQRCGYVEGLSLVPFNCLTVPLGKQWIYDVRACLDDYTALEPIPGVECTKCTLLHTKQSLLKVMSSIPDNGQDEDTTTEDKPSKTLLESLRERLKMVKQALEVEDFTDNALKRCQIPAKNRVSTTKTRQAVIARAPRSLVIHVNRSNFNELTGVQSKNLADVRYPQLLDLAPWCLGQGPGSENANDVSESWSVDPTESMLTDGDLDDMSCGRPYVLRAVITHYGRHENGHYICYRKSRFSTEIDLKHHDENTESWWRLSDEEVTEVDIDTVLSQGGVFMLFYEQVTSPLNFIREKEASSPELEADVINDQCKVIQHSAIASFDGDLPIKTSPKEEPPTISESGLPTPPSSPGRTETDVERPHESGEVLSLRGGDCTDQASASTEPASARLPTQSVATAQPTVVSEPAAPVGDDDAVSQSSDSTTTSTVRRDSHTVSPVSMRTAGPRNGRGSVGISRKTMGSVAGFVQAN